MHTHVYTHARIHTHTPHLVECIVVYMKPRIQAFYLKPKLKTHFNKGILKNWLISLHHNYGYNRVTI